MKNLNVMNLVNKATGTVVKESNTILETARQAARDRKDSITLVPELNKVLYSRETGAGLRIYNTDAIMTGGQVLFYNGVDIELAVGPMTIDIKKASNIIDIFDADMKDTDIVDIEVLGRVFDVTKWYDIVDGLYVPKKHIKIGFRYGRTVDGKYLSRLEKENVTRFNIETETGYKQRVGVSSNKVIKSFEKVLSSLDLTCQTVADIKLLINDMQHVGRNLQETGIDADKKFSLVIPMRLAKYINKETKLMSSYLKKNGKDVIKSSLSELTEAIRNNEDHSEFNYTISLDTDKDLIADGGRYWRLIADACEEVMNENVVPVLKEAKIVEELAKLLQIANTNEVTKSFTSFCKGKLTAYRNYAWNTQFGGEDLADDKKHLHVKADNHEEIRIAFKCTIMDAGKNLGLDEMTILACAIAADCTDGSGIVALKNEKMTARQLFKHEFADFYRSLGRTVVFPDGSVKELDPERVFYGETKAFGVTEEIMETLAAYEAVNRMAEKKYMADVQACVNKEVGAVATIAEIEVPKAHALEVDFVNGYAVVKNQTIYAKGIDGKAFLMLKDNTNVIATKEYDPKALASDEVFEGRLLVIDRCLKRTSGAKKAVEVTDMDLMDVKYYKERQAKDSDKSMESNKGKELKETMEYLIKLTEARFDSNISILNCSKSGLQNVIGLRVKNVVKPIATFETCGELDRLTSIIGKKKLAEHLSVRTEEQLLEVFRKANNTPESINSIDVKVKHFNFSAGSAFMILED